MIIKHNFFLFFLLITAQFVSAQTIEVLDQSQPCSIRGLSVVNNQIAWVSGSKGHVGVTTNGGKTWKWQQVKGFEESDFRDVEAFSEKEAIIMSSGTPALILKTTDGGMNWKVNYRNEDKAYFLDAMAFADSKHGYVLGDPINNKFLVLETKDSGKTWIKLDNAPAALPNEAAFAASGTCISIDKGLISIVTGGNSSRLISSPINRINWRYTNLPITHGKSSTGAFSAATGKNNLLIVGGDYVNNTNVDSVACYTNSPDSSINIQHSEQNPAGFQSCVAFIKADFFVSTGTSGTNITRDNGKTWKQINTDSYNVCQKAKQGKLVLLAGDKGKIALFKNY